MSKETGVELASGLENDPGLLLRPASFFVRSSRAAKRAVVTKTSWKLKLRSETRESV